MSYSFVDESKELLALCDVLQDYKGILAVDTETTGLDFFENKILLFQVWTEDYIYIVDVRKLGYRNLNTLVNVIKESGNLCILHNAKFDLKFILDKTGILLENVYDTM